MRATLILAIVSTACTDVDLYLVSDPDSPMMRLELRGEVCPPPPEQDHVPYKLLFVVDTSWSNSWTDPTPDGGLPRRERAVRDVIDAHKNKENVNFGVITFADVPKRQTFGFTRDLQVLNGAAANIGLAEGGTNYSDTIWTMIDFIEDDFSNLSDGEASRTNYLVYWLSDGYPTVGVTDNDALLPGVAYLRELLDGHVAQFRLDTAFLGGGPASTDPLYLAELEKAKALLQGMAHEGNGEFTDIEAGEEVEFEIEVAPVVREYVLSAWLVSNRNAQFGAEHPQPDSDGDGILDDDEIFTDPADPDTDGDGLRDGVELAASNIFDPTVPNDACPTGPLDTDGDGLLDCEETLLGTLPTNPDSDGDGFTDELELLFGTSPQINNPGADVDNDGVADQDEMRKHLTPAITNSSMDVERWAYRYEQSTAEQEATGCYQLRATNIGLYETRPLAGATVGGGNLIDLFAVFETTDGVGPMKIRHFQEEATFLLPDIRTPVSGVLEIDPTQFEELQLHGSNP